MPAVVEVSGFLDWRTQQGQIVTATDTVANGIWWDIEVNSESSAVAVAAIREERDEVGPPTFWPSSWGDCPPSTNRRRERLVRLLDAAPRVIPLIGNRYLLNLGDEVGNPVLSIHQTEVLLWADSLREFFLRDLAVVLPAASYPQRPATRTLKDVPFWGELLR